jgi:hypothetical protein
MAQVDTTKFASPIPNDVDPTETAEWLESIYLLIELNCDVLFHDLLWYVV